MIGTISDEMRQNKYLVKSPFVINTITNKEKGVGLYIYSKGGNFIMPNKKPSTFQALSDNETINKHGNIFSDPDITYTNNSNNIDDIGLFDNRKNDFQDKCVFCDTESYDEIDFIEELMDDESRKQAQQLGVKMRNRFNMPECDMCLNKKYKAQTPFINNDCFKPNDYKLEDVLEYIISDDGDSDIFKNMDNTTIIDEEGNCIPNNKPHGFSISSSPKKNSFSSDVILAEECSIRADFRSKNLNFNGMPEKETNPNTSLDIQPKEFDMVEVTISPQVELSNDESNSEIFILNSSDHGFETLNSLKDDKHFKISTSNIDKKTQLQNEDDEFKQLQHELILNIPKETQSIEKLLEEVNSDLKSQKNEDEFFIPSDSLSEINGNIIKNKNLNQSVCSLPDICSVTKFPNESFSSLHTYHGLHKTGNDSFNSKLDEVSLISLKTDIMDSCKLNDSCEFGRKESKCSIHNHLSTVPILITSVFKKNHDDKINQSIINFVKNQFNNDKKETIYRPNKKMEEILDEHQKNLKINTFVMQNESLKLKTKKYENYLISKEKNIIDESNSKSTQIKNDNIKKIMFGTNKSEEAAEKLLFEAEQRIKTEHNNLYNLQQTSPLQGNRVRRHIFRHYEKKSFLNDIVGLNDLKLDTIYVKFYKKGKSGSWQNNWFQLKGPELTCYNGKRKKFNQIEQEPNETNGHIRLCREDEYFLTKKYALNLYEYRIFFSKNTNLKKNCFRKLANTLTFAKQDDDLIDLEQIKIINIKKHGKNEFKFEFINIINNRKDSIIMPFLEVQLVQRNSNDVNYHYRFDSITMLLKFIISIGLRTNRIPWPIQ